MFRSFHRTSNLLRVTRLKDHSQLPTLAEAGAPDGEMRPWAGVVAPAGTPCPVLDRLQRDLVAAIDSPEIRARIETLVFELMPSTPAQLRSRIDSDHALYAPLVREGRVAKV